MTSINLYFNSYFQTKVVNKIEEKNYFLTLVGHFKRNLKQLKIIKLNLNYIVKIDF